MYDKLTSFNFLFTERYIILILSILIMDQLLTRVHKNLSFSVTESELLKRALLIKSTPCTMI